MVATRTASLYSVVAFTVYRESLHPWGGFAVRGFTHCVRRRGGSSAMFKRRCARRIPVTLVLMVLALLTLAPLTVVAFFHCLGAFGESDLDAYALCIGGVEAESNLPVGMDLGRCLNPPALARYVRRTN